MGVRGTGDVRGQQITVARPPTGETAIAVPVVVMVDAVVGGAGYSAPGHHGARVVIGPSLVSRRVRWIVGRSSSGRGSRNRRRGSRSRRRGSRSRHGGRGGGRGRARPGHLDQPSTIRLLGRLEPIRDTVDRTAKVANRPATGKENEMPGT